MLKFNNDINILLIIKKIITGSIGNLWFMYVIAVLYIMVPVIVKIKNLIGFKNYTIVSCCFILWALVTRLTSTSTLSWDMGTVFSYMSFFLLGNVIYEWSHRVDRKHGLTYLLCVGITIVALGGGVLFRVFYLNNLSPTIAEDWNLSPYRIFFSPDVIIFSICIFAFFANIKMNTHTFLSKLSKMTYIIYISHTMVLETILFIFKLINKESFIFNKMYHMFILYIGTLIISYLISCILTPAFEYIGIIYKKNRASV